MHRNPRPSAGLSLGGVLILLALLFFSWLQNGELSIPQVVLEQATVAPARPTTAQATATVRPTSTARPAQRATARPTERTDEPSTAQATAAPDATPNAAPAAEQAAPTLPLRGTSGLPTVAYAALPRQAHDTIGLIDQGGPYPFRQDDSVFQNREGLLPRAARGYYREYTVITPGEGDRGARRIVAGAGGELFYTDDHYDSFREVIR